MGSAACLTATLIDCAFEGLANIHMEPTRSSLYRILSLKRAAHLAR